MTVQPPTAWRRSRCAGSGLCAAIALACALLAAPAFAGTLTVKGSDTLVGLVQRWAQAFMKERPDVRVQVTGGGSGTGLAALRNGSTDIAMSSRPITPKEREEIAARHGAGPEELAVAKDGVAFFVNAQNPVGALTLEQLRALFLGDVASWAGLGGADRPVVLYTRETSSGTYAFVREKLLGKDDFAPVSQPLPGTGAVVNAVSREKWGLGFGGAAFARGVRTVAVRVGDAEVLPTDEAVRERRYPLARDLYFYLAPGTSADARAFVEFVQSDRGQALARKAGFFALR